MSPLQLEIAIHYYYSDADYNPSKLDLPVVRDTIEMFIERGLLRRSEQPGRRYEGVDEPLRIYVEALGAVPLPTLRWSIDAPKEEPQH